MPLQAHSNLDIVSQIFRTFHLNSKVYHNGQYCGNWEMEGDKLDTTSFHYICHGSCYLHLESASAPVKLIKGDLLLFTRGVKHILSSSSLAPTHLVADFSQPQKMFEKDSTAIVCAMVEMDQVRHPLLSRLPDWVVVHNDPVKEPWLDPLMRLINDEILQNRAGNTAALDKLADLLFIQTIRCYLQTYQPEKGVLAAMRDPQLHRVLNLIHADTAENWTIESLAHAVGLSRSLLAERFKQVMDTSVMNYVHDWKMQHARYLLKEEKREIPLVSDACGYRSESAFSKAFKKFFGYGPGAARKDSTTNG